MSTPLVREQFLVISALGRDAMALTNLLDNAVKFSPAGGTITVELIGDRLRVADEGPGIADEDLPHVFERFYRSEHARATTGSGLGLSIVKRLGAFDAL